MVDQKLTAVVTGSTAGVGRASAVALGRAGYQVALIARGQQGLDDAQAELESLGIKVLAISVDVSDAEAVEHAADRIEAELGPIDVWINAAMVTVFGTVSELSAAEFRRVTDVTYLGVVHCTQAALRRMAPRDRGSIVQVGSALSYRAIPLQSPYCAAKFAARGFTDALRCELIHQKSKVRLSMVQLPAHNTPQFDWVRNHMGKRPQPVPPIHTPEVAARAILRAVIDGPREIWLGRASFQAIVGNMVMPGLLDRMMARQAWGGQLTDEDDDPEREDNLFEPVKSMHRTSGRFTDRARDKAVGMSSETARKLLITAVVVTAFMSGWVIAVIAG
ncbi:MAG TPA: SDR family NAD(P)-dependent oxidoreductase [Pseudomonas xinjiangensis]|uniref:SDR family NAD(P)-dependent oxidoreductase n=2 Tax=root TaxID=1 RepID=A0A7V1FR12_9GAMM|nr:SDR family NAD(P)-dependent oxidoreductase [Halopseudomonas xinjiangensis]HEC47554.1 SDR family NAD(P)-dependent oxidoreductase [Halopseudomonas xinjiangensis]